MRAESIKKFKKFIWHAIIDYDRIVFDSYVQGWMMSEIIKSKFSSVRFYFNSDAALKDSAVNIKDAKIRSAFIEGFEDCINAEEKAGTTTPLVLKCNWLNSYSHHSLKF